MLARERETGKHFPPFSIDFHAIFEYYTRLNQTGLGRRQAASHEILDLAIGGSNPPAPATHGSKKGYKC